MPRPKKQTQKKPWTRSALLTVEEAVAIKPVVRPKDTPYGCGCGAMIEKRFRPGHNSQLLGRLKTTLAGEDAKASARLGRSSRRSRGESK